MKPQPVKKPEKLTTKKVTRITSDAQLLELINKKLPEDPEKSGDQRFPGYHGLWGEWVHKEQRWTDNRWYVSPICGYAKSEKRMSLAKAWLLRCLRMGHLK